MSRFDVVPGCPCTRELVTWSIVTVILGVVLERELSPCRGCLRELRLPCSEVLLQQTRTTAEEDVQFSLPKELRKDLKAAGEDTTNRIKR